MFDFLFGRSKRARQNAEAVGVLYGDLVAAARQKRPFVEFGVADDFEGRFEMLALMATLVMFRLRALPAPAAQVSQDLVDRLFKDLDQGLRRMGIGDLSVPKKMKVLGKSFYGRADAYTAALESGQESALRAALARNLFTSQLAADEISSDFIADLLAQHAKLSTLSLDALLHGGGWALSSQGKD